jgi:hypothetical protein
MAFVDEKGAVDLGINEGVSASPWRTVQLEEGMEPIIQRYRFKFDAQNQQVRRGAAASRGSF